MGASFIKVASKSAARERWEALSEETPAELIGEQIVYWSPGNTGHSVAMTRLGRMLGDPFESGKDGPGGWWILVEPEVEFGHEIFILDVAAWRRERLTLRRDERPIHVVPDFVCEVLSPSTVARDRAHKLSSYGRTGVENVWLIDPAARTLEALKLEGGRWVVQAVHAGDARPRVEPFDAVELELGALWLP